MDGSCSHNGQIGSMKALVDETTGKDSSNTMLKMGPDALAGYLKARGMNARSLEDELTGGKSGGWWGDMTKKNPIFKALNPVIYRRPSDVIGKENWQPIMDAEVHWNQLVRGEKGEKSNDTQKELWKNTVAPVAEDLKYQIENGLLPMSSNKRNYAVERLNRIIKGADLEIDPEEHTEDKLLKAGLHHLGTAVRHMLQNNVKVAGLHYVSNWRLFSEYGPVHAFGGLLDTVKNSKPDNPLKMFGYEIPALKEKGVYGKPGEGHSGIISVSDNYVKANAYHAAIRAGMTPEQAVQAAHKVSYSYSITDRPIYYGSSGGLLTLARFSVENYKYLGGEGFTKLAKGLATRNMGMAKKGAAVLLTYGLTQSVLSGQRSVMGPLFAGTLQKVAPDLWEKYNDAMDYFEHDSPVAGASNVLGKYANIDLSHYGGLEGIPLAVAASMWESTKQGATSSWKHLQEAVDSGDVNGAASSAFDTASRALLFMDMRAIPMAGPVIDAMADINARHLFKTWSEIARGDVEGEDFWKRWYEQTIPQEEPLTLKGQSDKERMQARHPGF